MCRQFKLGEYGKYSAVPWTKNVIDAETGETKSGWKKKQ